MDAPSLESSELPAGAQHFSNLLFSKLVNHEQVSVRRGPNAVPSTIEPSLRGGAADAKASTASSHIASAYRRA